MITVNVTQRDIELGQRGDMTLCPIARAVKRVHTSRGDVWAGPASISDGTTIYITPAVAADWMDQYDNGYLVEPFSFKLTEVWRQHP